MQRLFQLRPNELAFKKIYEQNPEENFQVPMTHDHFIHLIQQYSLQNPAISVDDIVPDLNETDFFQADQDVAVFQHYRYMPGTFHEHSFFEIAYVYSGTVQNFIGENHFALNAGDVLILAPHTKHAVFTYTDDTIMINMLIRSSTFDQHFMQVLPKNDLLSQFFAKTLYSPSDTPYLLFKTGNDKEIHDGIRSIYHEYIRNKLYKNTIMVSMMSIFFVTLLRTHEKDVIIPSIDAPVMNETTIFIMQYIQKNYATITLTHLSDFFNYSERQLQRIITTATGRSFSENIKKIRMEHAALLLETTNQTIAEIAEELGYYDSSNFRHVFKEYYHITPQKYRSRERSTL